MTTCCVHPSAAAAVADAALSHVAHVIDGRHSSPDAAAAASLRPTQGKSDCAYIVADSCFANL